MVRKKTKIAVVAFLVILMPFIFDFVARYQIRNELDKLSIKNYEIKLFNIYLEDLSPKFVYRASYTQGDFSGVEVCVFSVISTKVQLFDL